ncbi:MAG: PqqD family protein [Symploca sp. SIO2B6]|nr:PqqD family protein [Symploca sp. SIO2B6]
MSLDCTISNSSIVVTTKNQFSSELNGETVILDKKSGVYYGLNSVGAMIWNLIQEPRKVNEIRDTILAKYKIESEQCDRDILALLQQLQTEGLIEVQDEATV